MKYIILILIFIGCTNSETTKPETNENKQLDSILTKSQQNLTLVGGANQKSDSIVGQKVEHTVQKIQHLETENKQLKAENNELKDKLDDATDNGKPYNGLPVSPH